ncbi:hypothetical protein LINPERPRIM_LOCUS28097 [Linum perenne]
MPLEESSLISRGGRRLLQRQCYKRSRRMFSPALYFLTVFSTRWIL